MKVIVILQARISSSRLPGKVLKPLLGKPMIIRQIERIERSNKIDNLVVATSDEKGDDALAEMLKLRGFCVFRGSLKNALDRFYRAAKLYQSEHIVRLTGDCPLIDPFVIDSVIQKHLDKEADYTSNIMPRSFPDGLDVEVFSFAALKKAWCKTELLLEKEHVTPYIRHHSKQFKLQNLANDQDLSKLRWTVDYIEDFNFIERIYQSLYPNKSAFSTQDILQLIAERPELEEINRVRYKN